MAADTCFPGAVVVRADQCADCIILKIGYELAHVPDVAGIILGVPVEGVLDQPAIQIDSVAHNAAIDTRHQLGLVENVDNDHLHALLGVAAVGVGIAGGQR
jgi:hypothetical protein